MKMSAISNEAASHQCHYDCDGFHWVVIFSKLPQYQEMLTCIKY